MPCPVVWQDISLMTRITVHAPASHSARGHSSRESPSPWRHAEEVFPSKAIHSFFTVRPYSNKVNDEGLGLGFGFKCRSVCLDGSLILSCRILSGLFEVFLVMVSGWEPHAVPLTSSPNLRRRGAVTCACKRKIQGYSL